MVIFSKGAPKTSNEHQHKTSFLCQIYTCGYKLEMKQDDQDLLSNRELVGVNAVYPIASAQIYPSEMAVFQISFIMIKFFSFKWKEFTACCQMVND